MKLVRGRRDARWLPSRHNFALFRLAAYVKCRRARPEPADVILVVDRHQSALENFSVSIWIVVTTTCYLAATLFGTWPVAAALAASLPIALIAAELPFFLLAPALLPFPPEVRLRVQSAWMMLFHILGAAWFATRDTWARFAAWPVLVLVGLNMIAAVVVFVLRGRMAQLEASYGGSASAL